MLELGGFDSGRVRLEDAATAGRRRWSKNNPFISCCSRSGGAATIFTNAKSSGGCGSIRKRLEGAEAESGMDLDPGSSGAPRGVAHQSPGSLIARAPDLQLFAEERVVSRRQCQSVSFSWVCRWVSPSRKRPATHPDRKMAGLRLGGISEKVDSDFYVIIRERVLLRVPAFFYRCQLCGGFC